MSLGSNVTVATNTRIRKRSTIGNNVDLGQNVRIARDVTIEANVTIGLNTRIAAGAIIRAGAVIGQDVTIGVGAEIAGGVTVADGTWIGAGEVIAPADINPPGSTLIASSAFIDPSPPAGWTQCMGFTNTSGNDVAGDVIDGCLPMSQFRVRMWNASGTLIDDSYMANLGNITSWPGRAYLGGGNVGRTNLITTLWSTASFYISTNNADACGQAVGGSPVHISTGNGNVAGIAPGHSDHTKELGRNCSGSGYLGYTIAVYN